MERIGPGLGHRHWGPGVMGHRETGTLVAECTYFLYIFKSFLIEQHNLHILSKHNLVILSGVAWCYKMFFTMAPTLVGPWSCGHPVGRSLTD